MALECVRPPKKGVQPQDKRTLESPKTKAPGQANKCCGLEGIRVKKDAKKAMATAER